MIPLYSVSQIRNSDDYAISQLGVPGIVLMENASVSIFNAIKDKLTDLDENDCLGIICGKGNNGGDGFAAARHLCNYGFKVKVIYLAGTDELSGDARLNFEILAKLSEKNNSLKLEKYNSLDSLSSYQGCKIIIDALLGTGTKGILKSPYCEIIPELNKISAFKVAIDIPSGLDADTGYGDIIFNANITITLAELKKGLFIEKGYTNCGNVVKGYIGIPRDYFEKLEKDEYLIEMPDAVKGLPVKGKDINKYSAGKVFVVGGSGSLPGAALLTSNASMKVGAGAVILSFPESLKLLAHSKLDEVIVETYKDNSTGILTSDVINDLDKRFEWMNVLAIGPGLGRDTKTIEAVIEIIKKNTGRKIVIDADAIYALGNGKYREINLKNCVLTPHQGEFSNLTGIPLKEIKKDIYKYGKDFTKETGCYLVLKGAPTVIFTPAEKALVNTTGNAGMAKFGTGDVLTGFIAGILAQNHEIEPSIVTAVYLHSYTADILLNKFTEFSLTASDLYNYVPETIMKLRGQFANSNKTE